MKTSFKFQTLFLFCSLSTACCFGQKPSKVELLHANTLTYDENAGGKIRRLIGNVAFKQEEVSMYCDSAYFYTEKNNIDAFSNVHIQQGDSLNLYGDMLKYYGDTRKAELFKNIRMTDSKMTLTTEQMNYDVNANIANYTVGGKIVDKENTLTSQIGYYYSSTKELFFKKNVVLTNPEYVMNCDTLRYNTVNKIAYFFGPTTITGKDNFIYCENGWYDTEKELSQFSKNAYLQSKEQKLKGDSILYNRNSGLGKAFGNIEITDTVNHVIINGNYGEYNQKTDSLFVTGKTMLTQISDKDSMFLHADTLKASTPQKVRDSILSSGGCSCELSKYRTMFAYHHVKIFKSDLQGKCDSLVYSYKDSTIHLYKEPIMWSSENQLTAEFISLKLNNNHIEKMNLTNAAFIISQADTGGRISDSLSIVDSLRFNQIKGKNMTGFFAGNKLQTIRVEGNGQTIYYGKDKSNKYIGVNHAECSDILIRVNENKIEKISLLNAPDATFYPVKELSPKELILKDFKWKAKERPLKKEDIFSW